MARVISVLSLSLCLLTSAVSGFAQAPGTMELVENWALASATDVQSDGAAVSQLAFQSKGCRPIRGMPATVLEILQEDGVYPNLYVGKNILENVPQDLYKQDWWYRTVFTAPDGFSTYTLEFPGINYRAEIWVNGHEVADNKQAVGMYVAHEYNVRSEEHTSELQSLRHLVCRL